MPVLICVTSSGTFKSHLRVSGLAFGAGIRDIIRA